MMMLLLMLLLLILMMMTGKMLKRFRLSSFTVSTLHHTIILPLIKQHKLLASLRQQSIVLQIGIHAPEQPVPSRLKRAHGRRRGLHRERQSQRKVTRGEATQQLECVWRPGRELFAENVWEAVVNGNERGEVE